MKMATEIKKRKISIVRVDKSLNKYDDKILFPNKLENANEMLRKVGLTKQWTTEPHLSSKLRLKMNRLTKLIGVLFVAVFATSVAQAQDSKDITQKSGVTVTDLVVRGVDGTANLQFTVKDVTYEPGGINRRHFHPAAVTFYVISGTPVFQEEGKEPITLKPGESLFVPAGTTHSHWNPSKTEGVRWLEFTVAEKGKGKSIRKP